MRFTKMLANMISAGCFLVTLTFVLPAGQTTEKSLADSSKTAVHSMSLKPQTTCPVMGEAIDKKQYVDYNGRRIYVCCAGCIDKVKSDPGMFIKKLEETGQSAELIGEKMKMENKDLKTGPKMKKTDVKKMKNPGDSSIAAPDKGYWTCTMHPEIHNKEPGSCPLCGMKLVFKGSETDTEKMKSTGN